MSKLRSKPRKARRSPKLLRLNQVRKHPPPQGLRRIGRQRRRSNRRFRLRTSPSRRKSSPRVTARELERSVASVVEGQRPPLHCRSANLITCTVGQETEKGMAPRTSAERWTEPKKP